MAEQNKQTETSGEIDLIDIFNRIFKWFGNLFSLIGKGFLITIAFIYKNILVLGLSVVLGFAISFILKQTEEPLYESEITFRNNAIGNADMINHFNQLGNLITRKNISEVSMLLSIPNGEATEMVALTAYWVVDINDDGVPDYVDYKNKHNPADTINVRMSDRFVVKVTSLDPLKLNTIKNGLISYAESQPLALSTNNQRINRLNELTARANVDIKELDSLQKVKYFEETRKKMSETGQIVLLQEQQTQLYYKDIQNLIYQKQNYERELALYPGVVSVISDFLPSSIRVNNAYYYSKMTVPCTFVIAIIVLLLFKNRKKIIEVLNKY